MKCRLAGRSNPSRLDHAEEIVDAVRVRPLALDAGDVLGWLKLASGTDDVVRQTVEA